MINFNKPPLTGNESQYVSEAINSGKLCGGGSFSQKCHDWFEKTLPCKKAFLTPSCTAALEMAAILINIQPGDEVIIPSYTFVSTANAFVLRGARIIFVDIRPDTLNIDENLIEGTISSKTKAIVVVHYAGVACEMDSILDVAAKYNLFVIEDAAQGMMSSYKGKALGTIGHLGAYSFHETKNYTSGGEGGLLIVNDQNFAARAEIIREKGTNRSQFFRGQIDKYTWVDVGSSYLPSELQAAYLWGQLERATDINEARKSVWRTYYLKLFELQEQGLIELPYVPTNCTHNAHMFYIKIPGHGQRDELMAFLQSKGVMAVFHYVPLHNSPAGKQFGCFYGQDIYTTQLSESLLRLPLWYGITDSQVMTVVRSVFEFFGKDYAVNHDLEKNGFNLE